MQAALDGNTNTSNRNTNIPGIPAGIETNPRLRQGKVYPRRVKVGMVKIASLIGDQKHVVGHAHLLFNNFAKKFSSESTSYALPSHHFRNYLRCTLDE